MLMECSAAEDVVAGVGGWKTDAEVMKGDVDGGVQTGAFAWVDAGLGTEIGSV